MRWSIEGKVALVTGAGSEGTGRAIALRLARGGAAVAVNDPRREGRSGDRSPHRASGRSSGARPGRRVNCIVPSWIATEEVRAEIAAMSPDERAEVPDVLTTPEEIADLVVALLEDEELAGRVFVWWPGLPPDLMPVASPPEN